ncbi:MAG: alpha/beta fold hydrolase [Proteobacteria bacterium]|nr:alpha/beta fold hydrolase [Pseudomonadota bacterium]
MPMVQGNDKQISYVTGRGGIRKGFRTLVFVHGSGGTRLHWNYQRQFFEQSHNVVIVDLPGHGEAGKDGEDSVGAYGRDLLDLLRTLPGDLFCLIGHSLGGAIVQEFTLIYPQYVEALILVGTGARLRVLPEILEGIQERFEETVRLICDYAFSKRTPVDLIQKGVEAMLKTRPTVLRGDFAACNRFDIMDRVGNIQVPTLVVCGSDDLLTPPKYAHFLAEKIEGARLETIDGAGHMVMIEKPDEFNTRVMEFLQTLSERTMTS